MADSLNALATDSCAVVAAADVGLLAVGPDVSNPAAIAIPATGSPNQIGPAAPYPSSITVSGLTGLVTDVDLHLFGVTHSATGDIDMLLVGPGGHNLIVMSDVSTGGGWHNINATITFDDSATSGALDAATSRARSRTSRPMPAWGIRTRSRRRRRRRA